MLVKTLLLCFLVISCNQVGSIREVNTDWLSQKWVHSHEEDSAEQQYSIYRPASHSFPPSRGRDGFEIKDKGVLISHPIAPADGNLTIEQRWTLKDNELSFIRDPQTTEKYRIILLEKDKLILKRIKENGE